MNHLALRIRNGQSSTGSPQSEANVSVFIPVMVTPRMKWRWAKKNATIISSVTRKNRRIGPSCKHGGRSAQRGQAVWFGHADRSVGDRWHNALHNGDYGAGCSAGSSLPVGSA